MFKMSLNQIVDKIKAKSDLSEEEINKRIEEKCENLSGLVSKEGAAHIIANELKIKLFEQVSGKLKIKDILPGMRSVETVGVIQQIFDLRTFVRKNTQGEEYEGKVASFILADETSSLRVTLWNDQTDKLKTISVGKTIMIKDAYVKENNSKAELHLNDRSSIVLDPIGVEIKPIKPVESSFSSNQQAERKSIIDLCEGDNNIELLSFVVNAFQPRFFEICPECQKRAQPREEVFMCAEHGEVKPDYSYVINSILDDGTETIRAVFFRNQMEKLFDLSRDEILNLREEPEKLEEITRKVVGKHIKTVGRITKNVMFDRLEFVAQLVNSNPNPAEEIKKLDGNKNAQDQIEEKKPEESLDDSSEKVLAQKNDEPLAKTEVFGSGESDTDTNLSEEIDVSDI